MVTPALASAPTAAGRASTHSLPVPSAQTPATIRPFGEAANPSTAATGSAGAGAAAAGAAAIDVNGVAPVLLLRQATPTRVGIRAAVSRLVLVGRANDEVNAQLSAVMVPLSWLLDPASLSAAAGFTSAAGLWSGPPDADHRGRLIISDGGGDAAGISCCANSGDG